MAQSIYRAASDQKIGHIFETSQIWLAIGAQAGGYFSGLLANGNFANNREKFNVFLGHRRLSILDLSEAANQPLTDDDVTWIIFNGEIFNYVELRCELKGKGHVFETTSDTEVLLKIYKEYGEDGFHKLNGMWALAIFDFRRKAVVLSRDRFSIKPLYLFQDGSRCYFASEIKQLLSFLDKRLVNEDTLSAFLDQGLSDFNDETLFQRIYQLKPKFNRVISFESGRIEDRSYWDYSLPKTSMSITLDDAAEQFRELFTDSVKIRLRSDVPIGALLSGGLDSSAIAVVADELHQGFRTYSAVSETAGFSEEKYVDIVCREKNLKNQRIYLKPDDALALLDKVVYHHDEPIGGFSVVAHYQLMEQIRRQTDVVVVLSGQGGDEILGGYIRYFFFLLEEHVRHGRVFHAGWEFLQSAINGTCVRQFNFAKSRRYLPGPLSFLRCRSSGAHLRLPVRPRPIWKAGDLTQRQIVDIDRYSVPALTHYEDRNSMAHSLEVRLPYLDHRLVEFVLGLPPEMKIKHGWTKFILRKAMSKLPSNIRWRKDKQGFITPEKKWLVDDLSGVIEERFRKSMLGEMGIVEDAAFLDRYRRFREGDQTIWHAEINRVLMTELWLRRFF